MLLLTTNINAISDLILDVLQQHQERPNFLFSSKVNKINRHFLDVELKRKTISIHAIIVVYFPRLLCHRMYYARMVFLSLQSRYYSTFLKNKLFGFFRFIFHLLCSKKVSNPYILFLRGAFMFRDVNSFLPFQLISPLFY